MPQSIRSRLAITIAVAMLVTAVNSGPASADPGDRGGRDKPGPIVVQASQVEDPGGGGSTSTSYAMGAIGCLAQNDNIHVSTHSGFTRVNAESWVSCTASMPLIEINTRLYKHLFWVFWQEVGTPGSVSGPGTYQITRSNTPCDGNQLYRFVAYQRLIAPTGEEKRGWTTNEARINC